MRVKTNEEIAKIVEDAYEGDYWFFGVRRDREGINVGDTFSNSHNFRWSEDYMTEEEKEDYTWNAEHEYWQSKEELNGCCAVRIDANSVSAQKVAEAIKQDEKFEESGKVIYLVGGKRNADSGETDDEIIIQEGICLAIIDDGE